MRFTLLWAAGAVCSIATSGVADPAGQISADACTALAGHSIPAEAFSLPTTGGRVDTASWESDPGKNGTFCMVNGSIAPVDPNAPDIKFEVNLPEAWNGKMLQIGGGGYNGSIPSRTRRHPPESIENVATPLARGFVTLGDDSGHQADSGNDASFAKNPEALANYGYMHIKKASDAARSIVEAAYGKQPDHVYFIGGSTGGREGLTALLRWPEAYDGVVSNYPTARFMGLRLWGSALTKAVYADNSAGWIPKELVDRIATAAIASCDGLDGVEDGLVSNFRACRAQSDALLDSFRCAPGANGADCLTDSQIDRTIAVYHNGYDLPYQLANGFHLYEGYNSLEGVVMNVGAEPELRDPPKSGPNAHHSDRAWQFFTNFVDIDGKLDFAGFDVLNPGPYKDRLIELSEMIDATDPDLSPFAKAGGKLILVHGLEDASVTPLGMETVYNDIVKTVGEDVARDFMRFYQVPGLAHGGGNMAPKFDNLSAIDRWVTEGIAPVAEVMTDTTKRETKGRTRPLCEYPSWPKFIGDDANSAGSFECVVE